jgi:hypothetical protein
MTKAHISRCHENRNLQHNDEPEDDQKRQFPCFVAELPMTTQRTGRAAKERQMQSTFRRTPAAIESPSLVQPVGCEATARMVLFRFIVRSPLRPGMLNANLP